MSYCDSADQASEISPFKLMNRVQTAYTECLDYFAELMKVKREQIALGENDHGTMDLMGMFIFQIEMLCRR